MPMPTWSEIYLVGGLMLLTLIISIVSIYVFVRQYRREKTGETGNVKREPGKEKETDDASRETSDK